MQYPLVYLMFWYTWWTYVFSSFRLIRHGLALLLARSVQRTPSGRPRRALLFIWCHLLPMTGHRPNSWISECTVRGAETRGFIRDEPSVSLFVLTLLAQVQGTSAVTNASGVAILGDWSVIGSMSKNIVRHIIRCSVLPPRIFTSIATH